MKYTRLILFFLVLFLINTGCDPTKRAKEDPADSESQSASFVYDMKKIVRTDQDCKTGSCSEVIINYPEFALEAPNADKLNELISKEIQSALKGNLFESSKATSTIQLIQAFLDGYKEFKSEFPESNTPWFFKADVSMNYTCDEFITLSFSNSSYTGGAHPNYSVYYLNVSQKGKVQDRLSQFFKDPKKVKAIAEMNFRKQFNLFPQDNLADKGFMFEKGKFELSENFGFFEEGLIIYYNPYEIAPYSEGAIVITVPFSELQGNYKY